MNKATIFKIVSLLALVTAMIWAFAHYRDHLSIEGINALLAGYGIWAPLVFVLIYASATVLFLPGSALTLAGGFLFGPVWGTAYNLSGAILGATLAFLLSRYIAADWIKQKTDMRLQVLMTGVAKEGWKFVAIVRLVPMIPFNLLNYALGLTGIRLMPYVIASLIFMSPAAIAYTYLGSLGQTALEGDVQKIITRAFIAVGLLVLVAVIPWLVKQVRKSEDE